MPRRNIPPSKGGGLAMLCDRCEQPVAKGQAEELTQYGASGPGGTVVVHRGGCPGKPPPRQTYPESPRCW